MPPTWWVRKHARMLRKLRGIDRLRAELWRLRIPPPRASRRER
jgi:hypothetical protein